MHGARRIIGFGPIGWIALLIFFGVLAATIAGFDFQYHFYWLLNDTLGNGATMWFVANVHVGHYLYLWQPMFGLTTAAAALIAFHIHPRCGGWWRCALLVSLGVLQPMLFRHEFRMLSNIASILRWQHDGYREYVITGAAVNGIACLALLLATRSRQVLLIAVTASSAAAMYVYLQFLKQPFASTSFPNPGPLDDVIGPLWQIAVSGALLWWAFDARRHVFPTGCCATCGYDLRGTAHARCPECGSAAGAIAPA